MEQWKRRINGELHIPGKNGNWTEYETTISDAVDNILNLNSDYLTTDNVLFEVWNEPNGTTFWPYTGSYSYNNHFMDTWEHAFNTIKATDPDAKVVGPSFSALLKDSYMDDFLNEAQYRGVLPDFVSWHYPQEELYDQVVEMENFFNNNFMDIEGIHIGEYLTPTKRKWRNAAYAIAQSERASIKAGALDPETAQYGLLGGLVTFNEEKRGSWWVYNKYAVMDGSQTLSTTTTNHGNLVEAYATVGTDYGQGSMGILLGTFTQIDKDAGPNNNGKDENGDLIPIKKNPTVGVNISDLIPNYNYNYNIYRLKMTTITQ